LLFWLSELELLLLLEFGVVVDWSVVLPVELPPGVTALPPGVTAVPVLEFGVVLLLLFIDPASLVPVL